MAYRVDTRNAFDLLGAEVEDAVELKPKKAVVPEAAPAKKQAKKPAAPAAKPIVGETVKPAPAPVPVKTSKKVPEKLPEGAEVAPKEAKAPKDKEEKKKSGRLQITRPGQREFDRHSGTGRGTEQPKDGAGKANWGKDTDPKDQLEATPIDLPLKQPNPSDPVAPKEEENVKTISEFLKEKKKTAKHISLPKAAAINVEEETVDIAHLKPVASVKAAPKKTEEKPAAKKEAAPKKVEETKPNKVALKLEFSNEGRRLEGEMGFVRGPRPQHPHAPRSRVGEPVTTANMFKEPIPAPAAPVAAPAPVRMDAKAFPSL